MIIKGFAEKGGSLSRQGNLAEIAVADLNEKMGKCDEVTAMAVHESERGLYLFANVKSDKAKEPKEAKEPKTKRGK